MCEKCTATAGTFRSVNTHASAANGIVGADFSREYDAIDGEIVYVVTAGNCLVASAVQPFLLPRHPSRWCSEILSSKGLLYPSAKWVLNHTSPAPDTGGQNVREMR